MSFGVAQVSNPQKFCLYFSPICKSFLPRKFPLHMVSADINLPYLLLQEIMAARQTLGRLRPGDEVFSYLFLCYLPVLEGLRMVSFSFLPKGGQNENV